ncbi:MAG: prolyl oligopeptidase family serine peptidase [Planctomycetota bacterium]|nr:prolyl oligopeptidase family serine peptidase [Planctomycetota bacterium]
MTVRFFAALIFVAPIALAADGYKVPPQAIVDVLDAPMTPDVQLSPDAKWMLLVSRPAMPSIEDVMRPWIGLAGVRVDPTLRMPQIATFSTGIVLRSLDGGIEKKIALEDGVRIVEVAWAPSSERFVFSIATDKGLELRSVEVASATAERVNIGGPLNAVIGRPFTFVSSGTALIAKRVPSNRRDAPPAAPTAPTGPNTQESSGKSSPLRTYQDLLKTSADEDMFEYFAESELVEIALTAGAESKIIGKTGLIASCDPSPDGAHLLVERLKRPFSYVLPWSAFPAATEVWSRVGQLERVVSDVKLADDIPMEGVRTGPRDPRWQASAPCLLWWLEALDGGDPKTKAEKRDRWMRLVPPFTGGAERVFEMTNRARGLTWFEEPNLVLAGDYDRDRKWTRTLLVDLAHIGEKPVVIEDRSVNDRYGDPGTLATKLLANGERVVRSDGSFVYRIGSGASATGERPFLDRCDLSNARTERLWQCSTSAYERPVAIVASSQSTKPTIVTSYESPTDVPNYRLRELETGKELALTRFTDPQPAMRNIEQKLVTYKRADGVELSATLYTPKDRKVGERLPLFVWAYPSEFTDAATAGQVSGSQNRFIRVRGPSQILFALHGWAVMDNAAMPVVGDPETVNDTFLAQIVSNAQAAIDHAVSLGVADRERCAVGGHSYGAFMTANLLAHCDLFKAGVCRSGAYNRTLTPFGFQSERRTIWEAPKSYLDLSPFLVANKVNEPILFIHGEKDDNTGTFPIQSERMYQAVKGNGGTARLVVLPGEAHGYRARESVLTTVAEMFEWSDRFTRDAKSDVGEKQPVEAGTAR